MDNKKNIEESIQRALDSMDEHTRATAGPYFGTRLNARLAAPKVPNVWDRFYAIITKPVVAIPGIALILFLNIMIITSNDNADTVKFQADTSGDWQGYSTATTSALYDVETIEP